MKEELVVFAFGLISKFLCRTSSSTSDKGGIYLSLCGLDGYGFVVVIIIMGDDIIVVVNSKCITIYISIITLSIITLA